MALRPKQQSAFGKSTLLFGLVCFVVGMGTGVSVGLMVGVVESSNGFAKCKVSCTKCPGRSEHWNAINVYHGPIETLPLESATFEQNYLVNGSQADQDQVVMALTSDLPGPKYFVDLAANDAIQLSNTLQLESSKTQKWNGLCIEPNPLYWYRLAHRKCTVVGAYVGGSDNVKVQVSLGSEAFGGIIDEGMENAPGKRHHADKTKKVLIEDRFVVSVNSVFEVYGVPPIIDYLNLDVEGAEFLVMEEFDFSRYTFRILTVERPKKELVELLTKNGYVFVMLLVRWGETLWVHKSFLDKWTSMDEIKKVVKSASPVLTSTEYSQGMRVWNLDQGDYYTVK